MGSRKQERTWEYLRQTGRPSLLRYDTPEVQWALAKVRSYNARGMSMSAMADQVGLAQDAVTRLFRLDRAGMRRTTFEKIRRIRFDAEEGQRARVPLLGAQRRLQALRADGFPYTLLCEYLGHAPNSPRLQRILTGVRHGDHPVGFIIASTARQIEAMYDKLAGVDPLDIGVSQFAATYSRKRASAQGWAPSACWDRDTIDDPQAAPEWTGVCGTAQGRRVHKLEGIPVCARCAAAPDDRRFSPEKFARIRQAHGYTQAGLEKAAGLGSGTVNKWETGPRWSYASSTRRLVVIDRVLSVLDCTFEDISESEES